VWWVCGGFFQSLRAPCVRTMHVHTNECFRGSFEHLVYEQNMFFLANNFVAGLVFPYKHCGAEAVRMIELWLHMYRKSLFIRAKVAEAYLVFWCTNRSCSHKFEFLSPVASVGAM
jgi:hypothetical protein